MKSSDGDWVGAALCAAPVPTVAWAGIFEDRSFFIAIYGDILLQKSQHIKRKLKFKSCSFSECFSECFPTNVWYQIVKIPIVWLCLFLSFLKVVCVILQPSVGNKDVILERKPSNKDQNTLSAGPPTVIHKQVGF